MASLNTSTGDVQIQFKESKSRQYVNENEQASDGKKNGDIYDEPANIDENGRKTNNKQLQQSNSFVRCLMILVVVLVVIVALMACLNGASFVDLREKDVGVEIVLQRRERFGDNILFNRGFEAYEAGFGDICGEGDLWLGLQRMLILTQIGKWNVRISMRQFTDDELFWGEWTDFKIHTIPFYYLSFGPMVAKSDNMVNTTGLASGFDYHNGEAFSTHDRDRDKSTGNCASTTGGGGWWFKNCQNMLLNGVRTSSENLESIVQMSFWNGKGEKITLASSEITMIRVG